MKTTKAEDAARWLGLDAIRAVLGGKLRDYEDSLFPTSISRDRLEELRRASILSGLVQSHVEDLAAAVQGEISVESREALKSALEDEVSRVRGILRYFAQQLERDAETLETISHELRRNHDLSG